MKKESYVSKFKKMVEELQSNPKIKVIDFEFYEPATQEQLEEARDILTPEMIEFYSEANGFSLNWNPVDAPEGFDHKGRIQILPIEATFAGCYDHYKEDELYYGFDMFVPEAFTALKFESKTEKKPIIYLCGDEALSMRVTFTEYLDLLLESKGYWYWQTAITEPDSYGEFSMGAAEDYINAMTALGYNLPLTQLLSKKNNTALSIK